MDADDEYVVDYSWESDEEVGTWSSTKTISTGKSIIGLVVNDLQESDEIHSIGFLLWDRTPYLGNINDDL